ncbi:PaaX family transcriptional regulator C-terminal domain-containing protein [Glaciihabitans sp. dw_435]|uniref:PaaX family transcriptional regulator n=1 Tax=Glaciihabitans sp. dw_435 TaxID=2720081 RepID=UPI001BD4E598|nr:PaaX family transcriptional regulator C-terminal domain-containing protein [Glaciihabitans sp. dw_435]
MSAILDDMDSRPGSTTSLLRTIVGLYLRRVGGWVSVATLIALMEQLDTPAARTRTAVTRLVKKDLLLPKTVDRVAGYELNPQAAGMLEKGDRRIYAARSMRSDDPWCLVSFSIPEESRAVRHQLRRRLHWIGCGTVSPALWICPDYLSAEVDDILDDLRLREHATVFRTDRPRVSGELRDAIAQWWDLDSLERMHREFLITLDPLVTTDLVDPAAAFSRYIRGVDSWRVIPYLDPGLPADLLPAEWPGSDSTRVFGELTQRYADDAWAHVETLTSPR